MQQYLSIQLDLAYHPCRLYLLDNSPKELLTIIQFCVELPSILLQMAWILTAIWDYFAKLMLLSMTILEPWLIKVYKVNPKSLVRSQTILCHQPTNYSQWPGKVFPFALPYTVCMFDVVLRRNGSQKTVYSWESGRPPMLTVHSRPMRFYPALGFYYSSGLYTQIYSKPPRSFTKTS